MNTQVFIDGSPTKAHKNNGYSNGHISVLTLPELKDIVVSPFVTTPRPIFPSRIGGNEPAYLFSVMGPERGDEGKGIEFVSRCFELIAKGETVGIVYKANGGANSGHTVYLNDIKYALNLLPCGVLVPEVKHVGLGAKVFAIPQKLDCEVRMLESRGVEVKDRLIIDPLAVCSTNLHRLLDKAIDLRELRGTTAAGITPTAIDCAKHKQIYWQSFLNDSPKSKENFVALMRASANELCRLANDELKLSRAEWKSLFNFLTEREISANKELIDKGLAKREEFDFGRYLRSYSWYDPRAYLPTWMSRFIPGFKPFQINVDLLIKETWESAVKYKENIKELAPYIRDAVARKEFCGAEHGQAHWLDPDFGVGTSKTATIPSSTSAVRAGRTGTTSFHVVAVGKGYSTSVGTHLNLTSMSTEHPLYKKIAPLELGVVTKRQRAVNWPSSPELATSFLEAGFHSLSLRKIDVMNMTEEDIQNSHKLKICSTYLDRAGKPIWDIPRDAESYSSLSPEYIELEPWTEDISKIRNFSDLPENTKLFIAAYYYSFARAVGRGDISRVDPGLLPPINNIGVGGDIYSRITVGIPSPRQLIWMWEDHIAMLRKT